MNELAIEWEKISIIYIASKHICRIKNAYKSVRKKQMMQQKKEEAKNTREGTFRKRKPRWTIKDTKRCLTSVMIKEMQIINTRLALAIPRMSRAVKSLEP